ncbi:glycosyltransferase [Chloroflexota bacterium]
MKVLIISFLFAPMNHIGSIRITKFAKYLPDFGWEPVVLTVDAVRGISQTLPSEVVGVNIVRTPYFDLVPTVNQMLTRGKAAPFKRAPEPSYSSLRLLIYRLLRLMKPIYNLPIFRPLTIEPIGWYPYAVRKGLQIAAEQNIDIIFSTYGPSIPHLVASCLYRKTGIPWVAEFRDLWSSNPYVKDYQPFQFIEQQLEKRTLKACDLLISVSEPWAQQVGTLHNKRAITIPNGFDEDDYLETVPLTPKFTITYTGQIYPGKREPTSFLQAIGELRHEAKISPHDLEVRFFGNNVSETINPLIKKLDLNELVKVYGFVPFSESVKKQKESSALLLLGWNDERDKGALTGKIFEYLGAGRPILSSGVKGGEIDKLLKASSSGILTNEVEDIKDIILKWVGEFKQYQEIRSYYNPNQEIISYYTRREATAKLARAFDTVIAGRKRNQR